MLTPNAESTRRSFLKFAALSAATAPYIITRSKSLAADTDADGYTSLFDGKTLSGWHKNPQRIGHGTGGLWEVQDGAIAGEQDPPGSGNGGILLTDKKFGDFELLLEIMPDFGIDSGLFLRSTDDGRCVQMMVDYHDAGSVGHLYGEGTGGWSARPFDIHGVYDDRKKLTGLRTTPNNNFKDGQLIQTCTGEQFSQTWKVNDWNRVKVRCAGKVPRITTWINDLLVADWDGANFRHPQFDRDKLVEAIGAEGSIAVQVHGGKGAWPAGSKCRWRSIRIKAI